MWKAIVILLGAYWGISRGYLLPCFSQLLPKSTVFCYLLPVARSYLLQVAKWPFFLERSLCIKVIRLTGNFLIVARCGQKCGNCCGLRPNFHLLRVAGYLNTSQFCPVFIALCVIQDRKASNPRKLQNVNEPAELVTVNDYFSMTWFLFSMCFMSFSSNYVLEAFNLPSFLLLSLIKWFTRSQMTANSPFSCWNGLIVCHIKIFLHLRACR